jgi:hypothetical protein
LAKTGKMGIISGDSWVVAWSVTHGVSRVRKDCLLRIFILGGFAGVEFKKTLGRNFPQLGLVY